jgi:hypothetical protein
MKEKILWQQPIRGMRLQYCGDCMCKAFCSSQPETQTLLCAEKKLTDVCIV